MTRKPNPIPAPLDDNVDPQKLAEVHQSLQIMDSVQANYSDGRDLVNQVLGQAQAFDAVSKFSAACGISKIAFIKENKLYRNFKGKKTPHGAEFSGTWEGFCGLLGRSVDRIDEDIANLKSFGEEALDALTAVGVSYRELREFRRVPADQKIALIEAAKAGDKDTLLELAEDLIVKHDREKTSITKRAEEAEKNSEAKERLLADKDTKINDLTVRSLQKIVADTDWPDALIPLTDQIAEAGRKLAIAVSDLESCRIRLFEAGSGFDETTRSAYEAAFCHVGEVYEQALERGERLIAKERLNYDRTLGCYAADDNDLSRP